MRENPILLHASTATSWHFGPILVGLGLAAGFAASIVAWTTVWTAYRYRRDTAAQMRRTPQPEYWRLIAVYVTVVLALVGFSVTSGIVFTLK